MMNREVFLSLLAMDAYNRGYGQTVFGLPASGSIGLADIKRDSLVLGSTPNGRVDEAAGFYAIAYDWNNSGNTETVISFRGTNFPDLSNNLKNVTEEALITFAKDLWGGWNFFFGLERPFQADVARAFYEEVTGLKFRGEPGFVDPYDTSSNLVLTGHSLGGGLAGYVGSRAGAPAFVFDPIPFGDVATTDALSAAYSRTLQELDLTALDIPLIIINLHDPLDLFPGTEVTLEQFVFRLAENITASRPRFESVEGRYLEGEVAQQIPVLQTILGLGLTAFGQSLANSSGITPVGYLGRLAAALGGQQTIQGLVNAASEDREGVTKILNRGLPDQTLLGFSGDSIALHSQAWLTLTLFGEKQWAPTDGGEGRGSDWEGGIRYILPSILDDQIGGAFGYNPSTGAGSPGTQLSYTIAYSVLNEGALVFGDTGARALFDDADNLGKASSNLSSLIDDDVRSSIGGVVAEFAGLLAFERLEQTQWSGATDGVLSISTNNSSLLIDLTDQRWSLNNLLLDPHAISSSRKLVEAIFTSALEESYAEVERNFITRELDRWSQSGLLGIDSVALYLGQGSEFQVLAASEAPLIVTTNIAENINVNQSNAIIVTGDGADIVTTSGLNNAFVGGSDVDRLTGGAGDDWFFGGAAADIIDGGDGTDTAVYADSSVLNVTYAGGNGSGALRVQGDTLTNVENVRLGAPVAQISITGRIAFGTDLTIASLSNPANPPVNQGILARGARSSLTFDLNRDSVFSSIRDDETDGQIKLENFNTTIFATDFDDTIFDGSDEEKIIFGGAGNDTIDIAETLPASILIGGDGTDRFVGGHGNDVIIDHQALATSTRVLLNPDIIEPDPRFRSLVGSIDAGFGDDDIVIEIGGIAGAVVDTVVTEDIGIAISITNLPPGGDPSLEYDINAGKGNDRVLINFLGSVNYKYERGDGGDIVNLTTSGTFGSSDFQNQVPGFSIEQTNLVFDLSDYNRDEVTIRFGEVSRQVFQRFAPNFDDPTIFVTTGDLLIEFADGGSIFVENLIGLTSANFHTSYLGLAPEDDEVVFLSASFNFADDTVGHAILERSPLSAPPPPPSPTPPQISDGDQSDEDSEGGFGPSSSPAPLASEGAASNSQAANSTGRVNLARGQAGISANNAGGTEEPLEVRLQRGQFAFSGGTGIDRLLIEWTLDSLVVSLSDETLTVSDRWGVLGTTTLTGFEEVYVFETDETYTIQGFVDAMAARKFGSPVEGAEADDALTGTAIRDRILGFDGNDRIEGFAGDDIINAGEGDDVVFGGDGDDVLLGQAGNDLLNGGAGDDHLDGGLGDDTLAGGSGNDTYLVDGLSDIVVELEGEGIDRVVSSLNHVLSAHIEELSLVDQALEGAGNDLDNAILGNDANNVLSGLGGNDILSGGDGEDALEGGEGNDFLRGQSGDDVMIGGNGDDTLIGGDGTDIIDGGEGFDTAVFDGSSEDYEISINGDGAIEVLSLNAGVDFDILTNVEALRFTSDSVTILASDIPASGTSGDDNITGSSLGNRLFGLEGNDTLAGLEGNDYLDGGAGEDVLIGGAGDDRYVVDSSNDVVIELADEGYDLVEAAVSYVLSDNVEGLTLGSDTPTNGTGNALGNDILGDDQNNVLRGLGGDDHLTGSGGDDLLDGGEGIDFAEYNSDISNYEIVRRADGTVLINDLVGGDGTDTLLNVERLKFRDFSAVFPAVGEVVVNVADLPVSSANSAPVVVNQALGQSVAEDQGISLVIDVANFADADGDSLSLSVSLIDGTPLPAWLTFDGTRLVGLPPQDFNGVLDLAVTASDGALTATAPFQLTIDPVNDTPAVVQPLNDIVADEDQPLSVLLPIAGIEDVDGDSLTFTLTGADGAPLPGWLSYQDGRLVGTPPANLTGVFDLQLNASDGVFSIADAFRLSLSPVNDHPVVVSPLPDLSARSGTAFAFTIDRTRFADADGDALALSARLADGAPLPGWLAFDGATLSGTAPQDFGGTLSVAVTASDGIASVSDVFDLMIERVVTTPPSIALSNAAVNENAPAGTIVGTLSVSGSGAGNLSQLEIIETQLRLDQALLLDPTRPIAVAYTGSDTGINNTGLLLTSMGRYQGQAGQGAFTVWRLRNSNDSARTVRLNASAGGFDSTVTLAADTDTFVLSPVTGGSATHRLFVGATLVDTKAASTASFSYSQIVSIRNPMFVLDGSQLAVAAGANLDFERLGSAHVTVRASDGQSAGIVQTFTVSLNDVADFNIVTGTAAADTLTGTAFADELRGLAGNDTLNGRGDNDLLQGGLGTDTALFAGLRSTYQVVTANGTVTIRDLDAAADGNDGTDTIASIERLSFKNGETASVTSPIILDLDGNGVETLSAVQSDARFDLDGDGLADDTSWIAAGDAFLYLDRDGNGTMSGVEEISFVDDVPDAATDLAGLAAFDNNNDRVLDARDARFADFGVWRDADGDGAVDEGETASLAAVGIRAVTLVGTPVNSVTEFGEVAITNSGSFTLTNGTTRSFADAALTYFSAATNLPSLGVTQYDFGRKASKFRISAAGGTLTVGSRNARSGIDPLAGQLGANTILTFRDGDHGMFAPVVLDLDGDGVELVSRKKSRASFDYGGDGAADDTGWIGRDDGFLVIDRNNDGLITEASELSLASEDEEARSGLQGLARLDSNGDGVVDSNDARFGELRVWRDSNGNGRSDAGELLTLEQADVVAIRLNGVTPTQNTVKLDRNVIAATASFVRPNGTTSTAGDVSLAYRPVSSPTAPHAAFNLADRFGSFSPDLFLAPRQIDRESRVALLPSVDELAAMLGRADAAGVTDIFDRVSATAAPAAVSFAQEVTIASQVRQAAPLPPLVFDPSSLYSMMHDLKVGVASLSGNGDFADAEAPSVAAAQVGQMAELPQLSEDALAAPFAPFAAEDAEPISQAAVPDAIAPVPFETRQLLNPSGHELWGGPARIGSLPVLEGAGEKTPPSIAAVPVSSPNWSDGSADAKIASKLAMIRQDLSTFGATGVGEIDRLRQFPAQAMDIFA